MEKSSRTVTWVRPSHVSRAWPLVQPFLADAIVAGEDLLSENSLIAGIIAGNLDLFAVTKKDKVVGAAVTQVLANEKGDCLHIMLAGVNRDLRALRELHKYIEEAAKKLGIKAVSWSTKDSRWFSYARRNGYRCRFVEFVKEL